MKKRVLAGLLAALMVLGLTGCTTAKENLDTYSALMGAQLSNLFSGSGETDKRKALAAPGNFTCTAEGDYSFDGVENAAYYVIYLYKNGNTSYDYVSESITGSGTITGSIAALNYAYGDYAVTCVAYPDYTSETYRSSEPATAAIQVTGEVAQPSLTFFWDCFTQELNVIWLNDGDYSTTDAPKTLDVTLVGDENLDVAVEMDASTTSYTLTGAKAGQTYDVTATVAFDEAYVTNPSFTLDLGSVTCDEKSNFAPDGYEYKSDIYSYAAYPLAGENFDLTTGGEIGRWKVSRDPNAWMQVTSETAEYVIYHATPIDTADGDAYTFSVLAGNDDGSDVYNGNFGSMHDFTGTLHLYADNTFKLELDAIYMCTDLISNAEQWHNGSYIEGRWYENASGTVDLSYNIGSATDLGKGVR